VQRVVAVIRKDILQNDQQRSGNVVEALQATVLPAASAGERLIYRRFDCNRNGLLF
jgi:hypothetical protein